MANQYSTKCILTILCYLACQYTLAQEGWQSKWIRMNKDSSLHYIADEKGNIIPDFSRVGYYQGARLVPAVAVVKTIVPSGSNDDGPMMQAAIDEVSELPVGKNGFRGAILLKQGVYKIPGTLHVKARGIVLRGEGMATHLIATGKGQRNLIAITGKGSINEKVGTRKKIVDAYVPVGARTFSIESANGFKVGDSIVVFRPGTKNWIHDLKMDQIVSSDTTTRQWQPQEYDLHFERIITSIKGSQVTIDNPVVMAMEEQYGGGAIYKYHFNGRISNVAVEDLSCESEYANNEDEDHGWIAVFMNQAENGWVRNVTSKHFGYACVSLGSQSKNITVFNCQSLTPKSIITGGRRYSFNNDGQLNLFMNCFASEGRHDYVTGAKVCGPNVFYNCRTEKAKADIGPHHRWAVGTLYDNIITDGEINVQDRGNWGTGHGWAGVNQVIWNCTASKAVVQNPWVSGNNYVFGLKGTPYGGRLPDRPTGEWEGTNKTGLEPSSLYLLQVKNKK
ncbi:hypothetical protein OCK74_26810 [Chitinophagaceae bacterium LB-8]|uniref:Pectate lyase n=1 Tax=Paraflavisolibacter caeni TaxID=2982496 RepID=A0A9X3BKD6_9BACT|nr:hypothetical protein [Paraflavisolibacter caeni]MCU7552758.1 hypothetical protein [Paraflavisolibacter caeni]